jgi:hypothetical protein
MGFLAILQAGALVIGSLITIAGFVHERRKEKENQVFSNPIMLVACVAGGLIAANFLLSKKSTSSPGQASGPALAVSNFVNPGPAQQVQQISIRQQQADEAAAAVAGFFRKADEEAWVEEQIDRAQAYFARAKQSQTSKP